LSEVDKAKGETNSTASSQKKLDITHANESSAVKAGAHTPRYVRDI
jgi:hypothetical protein